MVRRIHEGTDSLEEQLSAVTEQQEIKTSEDSNTKENTQKIIPENVEIDSVDTNLTDGVNKEVKACTSSSSSEEIDEEILEGDESISKIGRDGKL